ncbi:hypothetical protein [Haloferax sp. Q22]|uniref:hypothetical protein n=1 Tax=Haloferax sp. (strain Q22) TaxID=1526048 RepID=UPI000737AFF0|nr:hypothetical protein [Haloferax sp. Q22]
MSDVTLDQDNLLCKEEVVEAKEDLDEESTEVLEKYISKLASYSKQEMSGKPRLSTPEYYQLRKEVLPEMFPDRDVSLQDLRRAIRVHFHDGRVPDEALNKDAGRGENLRTAQGLEARSTEEDDIDLGGLPEEVQEQLEDIDFESGEELLGRFHLYLTNETGLSPGDTVDYVREMDYQLGLNPDDHPSKQYTHEDELTSSARDQFSKFLDSSYAEKTEKDSEEGV